MKKKYIIIILSIIVILCGLFIFINPTNTTIEPNVNEKLEDNSDKNQENTKEEIKFLKEIVGIKAEQVELVNNPVGLKGEFIAPREAILKGVDYFLKDTKNSKMENIEIDIGKGYIYLRTTYKVNSFISTPIEVKVKPSLDESKNLVLQVYEFKFLDLNIPNWIVNIGVESFIKDWFPKDKDIKVTFDEGKVIIDKSNFESLTLNKISIESSGMRIDMIINLEKII
ncbi:MAG: hypothetical protein ACRDA3_02870 [Peptostreptococcaceae bacterium]